MAEATLKKIQLPTLSMFSKTPVYEVNGDVVFGLQQPVVIAEAGDDIYTVTLPFENRLDKISAKVYGTPVLWWALAQVNNLVDPLLDLPVGTQLRIPSRSRLPAT